MRYILGTVLFALSLGACSPEAATVSAEQAENAAMADAAAEAPPEPVVTEISGKDVLAVVVSPATASDEYPAIARKACAGKNFCKAFFWTDATEAATAFPMTDREVSTQVFTYGINRETGYDERLWNCAKAPRQNPAECLST